MSTFRNPVGPQPATVYWRRRLIVGLGVVAVIVVILLIVFAPKGGTPAANTTTPPASSAPTGDGTGDVAACSTDQLTVEATTDRASYTAEQLPQLSATVTNSGSAPCEIGSGADVLVYTVTSGDETIWTSTDCQSDPESATTVLAAGEETELASTEWDRTRSSTKTCDDKNSSPVTAEGASYHVTVSVDGGTSEKTRQIILN
jgi:hypothetical protein